MKKWEKILASSGATITGDHFVYKAGTHGEAYIDKERFAFMGAANLAEVIEAAAHNFLRNGPDFKGEELVGVLGPAMGAISYSLTMAMALEKIIKIPLIFFPARTELVADATGKKIHVIPDKLKLRYKKCSFIIFEDIVNNGTTIKEVRKLLEEDVGARVLGATCIVDRGGQTAESLGVEWYAPLLKVNMVQHQPKDCPLCKEAKPINTILGKGERWVNLFGQPPYASEKDFVTFWE